MSAHVRKPMRRDEFLAWERREELRYEFDGFQAIALPLSELFENIQFPDTLDDD